MTFHLSPVSRNIKTGPIPVTMSSGETCPDACPLKGNGCYASSGRLAIHWRRVTAGTMGGTWAQLLASVRGFYVGTLWRHNQAGDLPGVGNSVDAKALGELTDANTGRKGFTYTHKPVTGKAWAGNRKAIAAANRLGFTVNLSADSMSKADELASLNIGPVVAIVPIGSKANLKTPGGRTVIVCPAQRSENRNCANCGICQRRDRSFIVGFIPHGNGSTKVNALAIA